MFRGKFVLTSLLACLMLSVATYAADFPAAVIGKLTKKEQQNVQLVLRWWHEGYETHHPELAAKYMATDYQQHNPNVATGRDSFLELLGRMPKRPIRNELYAPPKMIIAKDDYVVMTFEREDDSPKEPGKTYIHYWTEIVRVANGLVAEHWDSAFMRDPATYNPPIIPPYERWQKKQGITPDPVPAIPTNR